MVVTSGACALPMQPLKMEGLPCLYLACDWPVPPPRRALTFQPLTVHDCPATRDGARDGRLLWTESAEEPASPVRGLARAANRRTGKKRVRVVHSPRAIDELRDLHRRPDPYPYQPYR